MLSKRKKNILFGIGLVTGIIIGMVLHMRLIGIAFGIIIGLAMREVYERNYINRQNRRRLK